jgi:hypothetical protein
MHNYAADGATQDCIEAVIEAPTADVFDARECANLNDKCASLTEENERLKNICESYMLQYGTVVDKNVLIKPLGIDLRGKIE